MSTPPNKNKKEKVGERPEPGRLDAALRPRRWKEYVGQEQVKKALSVLIEAAQKRKEPVEHLLLYGPAGLGKTTLAHLVAKEMNAQIKVTSGPVIERVGDLAALLTNLSEGDILFIDEAHRINKLAEEMLYSAMESGALDIIIGKGPSARTIQLDLPSFTLIAATTRISLLSSPLRSRFSGGVFRLEFYDESDIRNIVERSSNILGILTEKDAVREIALRSRRTPRIANQLLKRCRDVADVVGSKEITRAIAMEALELLDIDEKGLNGEDRRLLKSLIIKHRGGPVGLNTLAASISEDVGTMEEVYEPYLIRLGFIERTPKGRVATIHAFKHLGIDVSNDKQSRFF